MNKTLHVAVGVIQRPDGAVLIARRHDHLHQGGLWEFPGGKVEGKETVQQALSRELSEELAIQVNEAEPLIKIHHQYPDREVLLDVWRVSSFSGQVRGYEGQRIQWVSLSGLTEFDFPAANRPIITAATLPSTYAILEEDTIDAVMLQLQRILTADVKLIQLRLKSFTTAITDSLLRQVHEQCSKQGAELMINSSLFSRTGFLADGIHLTARDLHNFAGRPAGCRWLAASCHNIEELRLAESIGADFAVLAPVKVTKSHPETPPLGWAIVSDLLNYTRLPVYALGGMVLTDLAQAQRAGAQGIAGISTFS